LSTTDELPAIARALNGVSSAGQVRAAVGAALNAIHAAYDHVGDISSGDLRASATRELDNARLALEGWYPQIAGDDGADYTNDWGTHRQLVDRAYVAIAGVEGAASYVPTTSNLSILLQSISEAPSVFGKALGSVAKELGAVAGEAGAGVLGGLGVKGVIFLALGIVVVLAVLNRGTIIGKVLA
jgi:hypothetical protein